MRRISLFLIFISAILLSERLWSQSADEVLIRTTFRCLSWAEPIREELFVRSDGEMQTLRVHNVQRSRVVNYVGPNPVVFYRKTGEGGEASAYQQVAQVVVDPKLQEALFFFVRSEEAFRIILMEDSFSIYPTGSYRFYNFTDQQLFMKFGDDKLVLNPKETTVLQRPFEGDMHYPILVVVRESEEIKPVYSNVWRHNKNFRFTILISKSGSKDLGPIEFRVLSDFPENKGGALSAQLP